MPELVLNSAAAAVVTAYEYGPVQLDGEGNPYRQRLAALPGLRLDVQLQCLVANPALDAFVVDPDHPVHDCGPNGVRLFAGSLQDLQTAAPLTGSLYDLFVQAEDPDDD